MRYLSLFVVILACQRGGRLVELSHYIQEKASQDSLLVAADTLYKALNNPIYTSSIKAGDVGHEQLDSVSLALVESLAQRSNRSAKAGHLPDSWQACMALLRITERYYDIKPAVGQKMVDVACSAVQASAAASQHKACSLAQAGDTFGAFYTLESATTYLATPLPHSGLAKTLAHLHAQKAGFAMSMGLLSTGMSRQEAESVMGLPNQEDSVYGALTGDFGVMLSWDTVSAIIKKDTITELISLPDQEDSISPR